MIRRACLICLPSPFLILSSSIFSFNTFSFKNPNSEFIDKEFVQEFAKVIPYTTWLSRMGVVKLNAYVCLSVGMYI